VGKPLDFELSTKIESKKTRFPTTLWTKKDKWYFLSKK